MKDHNPNLDNDDGSQLKYRLSEKLSPDTGIPHESWEHEVTVGDLLKYLIDKFYPW